SVSVQALGGRVPNVPELVTQEIRIPADMVGCIIGKAGSRITEIRRLSGSRISIAKASESEAGERLFTITGTRENNEKALYLLYGQLEAERDRRLIQQQQQRQLQVAAAAAAAVASSAPGGNGDMGSIVSGHESLMEEH
ncbi:RNA binding protein, heterogenous nuclear RNP-K like protein, partial [Spiromyces aspiralis]